MTEGSKNVEGAVQETAGELAPTVFLSYPFGQKQEWIKHYASAILGRWGYVVDDGSQFEGLSIADAVQRTIGRARTMVAFLTKRRKLANGGWVSSDWVLQEIGFARGKDVPVIAIVEAGVDVKLGILSDVQSIPLDPKAPYHSLIRLRSALKSVLPNWNLPHEVRIEHIAQPTTRESGKQWWDFWMWVDTSNLKLSEIESVNYQYPPSFSPRDDEEKDRTYAFGNYGATNKEFMLKVVINYRNAPKQELDYRVTLDR
jgi:hypothetical protein